MIKKYKEKKIRKQANKLGDKYDKGDYDTRKKIRDKQDKKFNKTIKKIEQGKKKKRSRKKGFPRKQINLSKKDKYGFPKGAKPGDTFTSKGQTWKRIKGRGSKRWKKINKKEVKYPKPIYRSQ